MIKFEHFALTVDKSRLMVFGDAVFENSKKVLIIGNNSVGKTLFLKAVEGSNRNFAGTIHFPKRSDKLRKRAKTVLIQDTPCVILTESVWKNLLIPLGKISKQQKVKIFELLKAVHLERKINLRMQSLSRSEIKMIELCRAILQSPEIILLDDLDIYFDETNFLKAMQIINYASANGSIIVAAARCKLAGFDDYYLVQEKSVIKLD